jgi:hypothetical protein
MEHSPSWEAKSLLASQKMLQLLWNQKTHPIVHKSMFTTGSYPEPYESSPHHPTQLL